MKATNTLAACYPVDVRSTTVADKTANCSPESSSPSNTKSRWKSGIAGAYCCRRGASLPLPQARWLHHDRNGR